MALVLKDRVKETTTTTGTGTVTLAGAEPSYQSFSVIGDGNTTYYTLLSGSNWEVGIGTYTASGTTLSRDTILESNNGGSAISLSGTSDVFCTYPAERSVNTADIGVSVQAYDADTAKYDDTTANFTGTLQNGGSNVVVDSDIGSTVQAYDADLTTLGGLAKTDGNFIVGNGTAWVAESGATARTSLGLGTAATSATGDFATAAQGTLADSAVQPSDNISTLTNDSGFITGNQTITLSGDASGSGTTAITVTVADDSHNHIISNVDGLQTALDAKAALSGANFTGNVYSTGNIGLDSTDYIKFTNNARMDVYVNGSNEFRFESDGDFHADGDVIAYSTTTASDEKLKDNIKVVDSALDKVCQLKGVTFTWKRDDHPSAGVIAQDVQKVLPEAVKEITDMKGSQHLTVNYPALTSILIESIKELKLEIEQLKGN
jgi:hypothetical protein